MAHSQHHVVVGCVEEFAVVHGTVVQSAFVPRRLHVARVGGGQSGV